jgi:hypothetical protein
MGLAVLLASPCACTRVNVTPLGATPDGRRQYEITCNQQATQDGSCHEKAVALCNGSYETQGVGSMGTGVSAYGGQTYPTRVQRVLLIACNPRRIEAPAAGLRL